MPCHFSLTFTLDAEAMRQRHRRKFLGQVLLVISLVALFIAVALFYLVVEQLEGNVLTPIVQHRMVSLPPALVLSSVLAMGLVFGLVGVLVATPLTVVVFIVVRMLYLEDVLGESSELDSKR
ncbi:hypothetical protein C7293_09420 [filamentous cyanobacterium CCT1]|nr:hypothetical protein C7293_09420 [filamentous cyanobacterium CCT1]PSN81487.1 hypothetical protein C8B47_00940 [filamentous cyanobacterium CCP4]